MMSTWLSEPARTERSDSLILRVVPERLRRLEARELQDRSHAAELISLDLIMQALGHVHAAVGLSSSSAATDMYSDSSHAVSCTFI